MKQSCHKKSICHPQSLCHCFLVSIAMMFPDEFNEEAHVTLDKFLNALCLALSERYRWAAPRCVEWDVPHATTSLMVQNEKINFTQPKPVSAVSHMSHEMCFFSWISNSNVYMNLLIFFTENAWRDHQYVFIFISYWKIHTVLTRFEMEGGKKHTTDIGL